ncbi:uncharacterized protein MELLADRAFT_87854 [Melampsora larici-populina 98AG31]|uniref:Uncharacterized protein n=1 Tax=Melampsora larici-populina (strain 98AG31 / pathotype 3-4-7) TaxID=747676 RepID=F4RPQ4_MELLP|nr:uncharacterized protein MELLADRAFT_87854 [Melampsora larici-populina 98AG31]EGG05581.1 hypothetical protein MELLADRAFT_87854 [Melampsora larici-populina 98AG31]
MEDLVYAWPSNPVQISILSPSAYTTKSADDALSCCSSPCILRPGVQGSILSTNQHIGHFNDSPFSRLNSDLANVVNALPPCTISQHPKAMSTSNIPLKQSYVITILGVVKTGALLPPSDSRNYSYRACTVAITTKGWNLDNHKEYDSKWTAYCSPLKVPNKGKCFVTKARFLPVKDTADFNRYYEADHKIFVGTSETFTGVLHNNTALTSLGIISSCRTIRANDDSKSVLCFVMKHIDYQPQAGKNQYFEINYRIRPTQNMEQSQKLVQDGRETLISGFIIDFDSGANRFIIKVTSVSPCTGNKGSGATKTAPSAHVTPAGHVATPVTPMNAVAGPSSAPAATTSNKRKAAAAEEPIPLPLAAGRQTRPANPEQGGYATPKIKSSIVNYSGVSATLHIHITQNYTPTFENHLKQSSPLTLQDLHHLAGYTGQALLSIILKKVEDSIRCIGWTPWTLALLYLELAMPLPIFQTGPCPGCSALFKFQIKDVCDECTDLENTKEGLQIPRKDYCEGCGDGYRRLKDNICGPCQGLIKAPTSLTLPDSHWSHSSTSRGPRGINHPSKIQSTNNTKSIPIDFVYQIDGNPMPHNFTAFTVSVDLSNRSWYSNFEKDAFEFFRMKSVNKLPSKFQLDDGCPEVPEFDEQWVYLGQVRNKRSVIFSLEQHVVELLERPPQRGALFFVMFNADDSLHVKQSENAASYIPDKKKKRQYGGDSEAYLPSDDLSDSLAGETTNHLSIRKSKQLQLQSPSGTCDESQLPSQGSNGGDLPDIDDYLDGPTVTPTQLKRPIKETHKDQTLQAVTSEPVNIPEKRTWVSEVGGIAKTLTILQESEESDTASVAEEFKIGWICLEDFVQFNETKSSYVGDVMLGSDLFTNFLLNPYGGSTYGSSINYDPSDPNYRICLSAEVQRLIVSFQKKVIDNLGISPDMREMCLSLQVAKTLTFTTAHECKEHPRLFSCREQGVG